MTIQMQSFSDSNFYSLIDRVHGALELLQFEHEIVAVTTTSGHLSFYGAIFYKEKLDKKS